LKKLSVPLGCYDPIAPSPWVSKFSNPMYKIKKYVNNFTKEKIKGGNLWLKV